VITGNDLVVGTYGHGIWILDDISPLRQMTPDMAAEDVHLFKPGGAVRVHRNVNQDTPFPPEVPHALNPPDGAIIYYWLKAKPAGAVTLDVVDASGSVVRHLSSVPAAPVSEAARPPEPNFWVAAPQALPASAGINRTSWDLRYDSPGAFSHSFEINANPELTPPSPQGPMAPPGTYTIRLTVGARQYTGTVTVTNDPRSPASAAAVAAQHALQMKIDRGMTEKWDGYHQAAALRTSVAADTGSSLPADVVQAAKELLARIDTVAGSMGPGRAFALFRRGGPAAPPSFVAVNGNLGRQLNGQDNADMAPTPSMLADYAGACQDLAKAVTRWRAIRGRELVGLNAVLGGHGLPTLTATGPDLAPPACGETPRHR